MLTAIMQSVVKLLVFMLNRSMQNVVILNVTMYSIFVLNVIIQNVVMLSVNMQRNVNAGCNSVKLHYGE
jgi:hypothetical protein